MKTRMLLAATLALAFAGSAFAQNDPANAPATPPADQAAPADPAPMSSDAKESGKTMGHHGRHHRGHAHHRGNKHHRGHSRHGRHHRGMAHHRSHGRAAGDPPVIDHSADHMIVPPTSTSVAVPPAH